ncbi:MAG: GGDEF domain-containing protein [Clostridia bacterium]|nr:GGDEF domain-containing protein [Clostridia bacterium]
MTGILEPIHLSDDIEEAFNTILENETIRTVFQPIINIKNGDILGYEALSRGPENSILASPTNLLSVAEALNKTWELEQLLRTKALEHANFSDRYLLFLNIDPNIIYDNTFKEGFTHEFLNHMAIEPSSIVFELTERSAIKDYNAFKSMLKHYTEQGYSIAIDDAGSGYSGLKSLYEIYPEYLKIDMDFVRHINTDVFKQSIVKNLLEMAQSANIKTIAEGIETADELRTLIRLGVEYGQGYFIQKPCAAIAPIRQDVLHVLEKERALIEQVQNYSHDYHYIHHLLENVKSFAPEEKCLNIYNYLNENNLAGSCICQNNFPIGIVQLREINAVFAKQYGHSVYSHRPVSLIMDCAPLIVDYFTPIHTVAEKAMARNNQTLYDDIIVCKGSSYAGMVTMKKLLEYAINYEKNYAKELNPLTSLPGNVIINRVMQGLLKTDRETIIIYADLDNFKVYNDIYGFDKGDKIIKLTAEILYNLSNKYFPNTTFLGHIGGDDFIMVSNGNPEQLEVFCKKVIQVFDECIAPFFNDIDKANGYIMGLDRDGKPSRFNLTSITLAGIVGNLKIYDDVENLSSTLAKLKKEAKKIPHSSFLLQAPENCRAI